MYIIDGKVDPRGIETDRRARQYAEDHGVNYASAIRVVMSEQRQRDYSAENGPWNLPEEANPPPGISEAYRALGAIVTESNRDLDEAARRINAVFDGSTIYRAAQFVIERRVSQIVSNISPGHTDVNMQRGYAAVQRKLPGTWAVYLGSDRARMTAEAVQEMFPARYSKGGPMVKTYSSDHVRYDANGNQFRTYSFDR